MGDGNTAGFTGGGRCAVSASNGPVPSSVFGGELTVALMQSEWTVGQRVKPKSERPLFQPPDDPVRKVAVPSLRGELVRGSCVRRL